MNAVEGVTMKDNLIACAKTYTNPETHRSGQVKNVYGMLFSWVHVLYLEGVSYQGGGGDEANRAHTREEFG